MANAPRPSSGGYTTEDAARIVGLPSALVRALAADGVLQDSGDGQVLGFCGLRILRTARQLVDDHVPGAGVRRALRALCRRLGSIPTSVHLEADGPRVLVREGRLLWDPETGQLLLPLVEAAPVAGVMLPWRRRPQPGVREQAAPAVPAASAEEMFEEGCDLEAVDAAGARECYRKAIALDPRHADAHVNLGRLLHEEGRPREAAELYRRALALRPDHATAAFDLGVALAELGRHREAIAAYERAVAVDPSCADAHYNLARLYERLGRKDDAMRSLMAYRRLTRQR